MKKIKFLSVCFILLTSSFLTSCSTDVEPLDPAVNLDNCTAPSFFQASDFINGASINLSWVPAGSESSWEVNYGLEGFSFNSGTKILSSTTNLTINDLVSTSNYEFYIRSVCGENSYSEWIGPISVNSTITVSCVAPTNLSAIRSTTNPTEINVSWTLGESETSWEIQYGISGFIIGTGATTNSNTMTKLISGLQEDSAYDFYVRSICSATEKSNWVGPITVIAVEDPVNTNYGYMSANVNGIQYDGMKPYFYPITGAWATINELIYGPEVLHIQGNSNPLSTELNNFVEINLALPKVFWEEGTYELESSWYYEGEDPKPLVNLIVELGGTSESEAELPSTITILEFNTLTKRIKGTFSFTYLVLNNEGESGPYNVINGTFDYPINPEALE